jgi:hypothetical protein
MSDFEPIGHGRHHGRDQDRGEDCERLNLCHSSRPPSASLANQCRTTLIVTQTAELRNIAVPFVEADPNP